MRAISWAMKVRSAYARASYLYHTGEGGSTRTCRVHTGWSSQWTEWRAAVHWVRHKELVHYERHGHVYSLSSSQR